MNWMTLFVIAPGITTLLGAIYGYWRRPARVLPKLVHRAALVALVLSAAVSFAMPFIAGDWIYIFRPRDAFYHELPFLYIWPVFMAAWCLLSFALGARITGAAEDTFRKVSAGVWVIALAVAQGFASFPTTIIFSCALGAGCT